MKVRRRKFKDPKRQEVYDWFRANKPGPATKGKGAAHNAYFVGFTLPDLRNTRDPQTMTYVAWAAGVDNAREAAGAEQASNSDSSR